MAKWCYKQHPDYPAGHVMCRRAPGHQPPHKAGNATWYDPPVSTAPDDLPDVEPGFDHPDSLDSMAWAEAFAKSDRESELGMDGVATWFAAALIKGQQDPTGEVLQEY